MTMLDKCARALSGAPFPSKAAYRKARAVLEALRDPTPEMQDAGWYASRHIKPFCKREMSEFVWSAMIDEALKERT